MPPRKRVDLPDHVREAVLADIALTHAQALDAEERDKIRIYLGTEQGLTTREIADEVGLGQTSVSKYAREGKEAYERRQQARSRRAGEDPDGPAEPGPIG
jgi:DNA-directed RNA polymerase specialized sigma subunit